MGDRVSLSIDVSRKGVSIAVRSGSYLIDIFDTEGFDIPNIIDMLYERFIIQKGVFEYRIDEPCNFTRELIKRINLEVELYNIMKEVTNA
jgi:hypothetical protein